MVRDSAAPHMTAQPLEKEEDTALIKSMPHHSHNIALHN